MGREYKRKYVDAEPELRLVLLHGSVRQCSEKTHQRVHIGAKGERIVSNRREQCKQLAVWKRGLVTLALSACCFVGGEAWAGHQLLFQVKTNNGPNKVYQFFAVTEGKEQRLIALRYYRKSLKRVKIWQKRRGQRVLVSVKRWIPDLCYPYTITFAQIQRGVPIFRKSPTARMSPRLKRLVQKRDNGTLSAAGKLALRRASVAYCREQQTKSRKGRFINSIRGYGHQRSEALHPVRGGHIVVTYLRNGLLNFFRGNYRYVVLKINRVDGRWALRTAQGHDATQLFFKAFSLGVSAIKRGFRRGAPAIPSRPCRRWIEKRHGTCKLSAVQRRTLPRG